MRERAPKFIDVLLENPPEEFGKITMIADVSQFVDDATPNQFPLDVVTKRVESLIEGTDILDETIQFDVRYQRISKKGQSEDGVVAEQTTYVPLEPTDNAPFIPLKTHRLSLAVEDVGSVALEVREYASENGRITVYKNETNGHGRVQIGSYIDHHLREEFPQLLEG